MTLDAAWTRSLPEGWRVDELGKLLAEAPKYGIGAPAVAYEDDLPTYIRITDITDDGRYTSADRVSVEYPRSGAHYLQTGDIVLARTGASVGKSYLYRPADGPLVFAGFLIRARPEPTRLHPAFAAAWMTTAPYWDWVQQTSMRSGQPGINATEYAGMPIPVPPLAEQFRIVKVLADTDSEIEALADLIEKRRSMRIGVAQALLSGSRRLAGFTGPRRSVLLGDVAVFSKGKGITKESLVDDGVPCVRYGELYTHHRDRVRAFYSFIPPDVAKRSQRLQSGDLLFAASGETAEEIGICAVYLGESEAYAGGDIIIAKARGEDPLYMAYLMNSHQVVAQKTRLGQGDAVVHISARNIGKVELHLPPPDEQRAVASAITDMDRQLELLEVRMTKLRAMKGGMVQELMTGRTRLS